MGSNQSQEQKDKNTQSPEPEPPVVTIDRSEIPEAYQHVYITENVIKQISGQDLNDSQSVSFTPPSQKTDNKSSPEIESKEKFVNTESLEDSKRIFKETVQKVDKQFFNYRRENACAENEKEIIDCLAKNANKIINCQFLWSSYNNCISNFHKSVLKEKSSVV